MLDGQIPVINLPLEGFPLSLRLTKHQLREFELAIDEINLQAEQLDPSVFEEAQTLEMLDKQMEEYISVLEKSYRQSRIQEIGLKLISQ